jgi:hypothetical protein
LSEQYLIYITSFNFEKSGYYVALENPANDDSDLPYELVGRFDNLKLEELEELYVNHLRIEK